MVRIISQLGRVILLSLLPIIASLPSHAHGSESHRPKKEINILKKPNLQNPDRKIDNKNMKQNEMMEENNIRSEEGIKKPNILTDNGMMSEENLEIIDIPAIAEESNSISQPAPIQVAKTMPQGLGETLSILLVVVPAGLYALKHRR